MELNFIGIHTEKFDLTGVKISEFLEIYFFDVKQVIKVGYEYKDVIFMRLHNQSEICEAGLILKSKPTQENLKNFLSFFPNVNEIKSADSNYNYFNKFFIENGNEINEILISIGEKTGMKDFIKNFIIVI